MDDKLTHIILTDHALRYGLDGKSAYEIAQKYGYEGTEQEYAEGPVIAKDKANKAADSADKAAERAKKSASNADQQAARAKSLADHPPKIVTVDDTNYWAFWDEEANDYMPSSVRSDGGPIFATFDIDPATMLLGVNYQPGYGHGSEFELKDDGHLYTKLTTDRYGKDKFRESGPYAQKGVFGEHYIRAPGLRYSGRFVLCFTPG